MQNIPIFILGLDKAKLLALLYNAASPRGIWFCSYVNEPMTAEQAQEELDIYQVYEISVLKGRILNVDLSGDFLDATAYNQHNGWRCAEWAIEEFLDTNGDVNPPSIQDLHRKNLERYARSAKQDYMENVVIPKDWKTEEGKKIGLNLLRIQKALKALDMSQRKSA